MVTCCSTLHWRTSLDSNKTPKDMMPEDETPSLEGVEYATGDKERAITRSLKNNEIDGTKQKQCSAVDVSDGESLML